MKRIMLVLLFTHTGMVCAGDHGAIYKCVDRKGHATYQNAPCAPHSRTDKVRGYVSNGDDPEALRELRRTQWEMYYRNQRPASSVSSASSQPDEKDCQNARLRRDRTRKQIGSQLLTHQKETELCAIEARACGWCRLVDPVP